MCRHHTTALPARSCRHQVRLHPFASRSARVAAALHWATVTSPLFGRGLSPSRRPSNRILLYLNSAQRLQQALSKPSPVSPAPRAEPRQSTPCSRPSAKPFPRMPHDSKRTWARRSVCTRRSNRHRPESCARIRTFFRADSGRQGDGQTRTAARATRISSAISRLLFRLAGAPQGSPIGVVVPKENDHEHIHSKNTICLWYDQGRRGAARSTTDFPDSPCRVQCAPVISRRQGGQDSRSISPCSASLLGLNEGPSSGNSEAFSFQLGTQDQADNRPLWMRSSATAARRANSSCKYKWGFPGRSRRSR